MKKILFIALTIVAAGIVLSSCASTSKASTEKSDVAKEFAPLPDKGTVYLFRSGKVVGGGIQLQVKVNGLDAGGSGPGTFFKWDLKPGTYAFSSFTSESSAVVEIDVKAGEIYFVEQQAKLGLSDGRVSMKQVSDSKGKAAVKQCKLLVSTYRQEE